MNKNLTIALVFLGIFLILIVGFAILKKSPSSQETEINTNQTEKETPKTTSTEEKKTNTPSYPGAVVDKEKCGKDAFYVKEKSADFVKNYCKFLRENGWKLVHQDYPDCEDIQSFGGGYNYEKGSEKMSISVIRYGEDATCFWVYTK